MGDDVKQITKVKEWLQGDLFGSIELEQGEDESLGCVPIEEVEELLKKCAYELGIVSFSSYRA